MGANMRTMPPPTMAQLLDELLDERGLGVRTAARLLAADDPRKGSIEAWRRKLSHYRSASRPEEESAAHMERVFDLPSGYFPRVDRFAGARTSAMSLAEAAAQLADAASRLGGDEGRLSEVVTRLEALIGRQEQIAALLRTLLERRGGFPAAGEPG